MRLEAKNLVVGYGRSPVLKSINLALDSGEFVGLIGPNGCGKSTLLRALINILKPTAGTVILDGKPITSFARMDIARRVGWVPQMEEASFDFSVRDVVLMGRHPHIDRFRGESPEDYELVANALADADLLHLADRPITQLSGGEHRRVLFARSLAQQTPLLLLDEPTAHLDITHQHELLSLVLKHTRERNSGALAALHDLNQAAEFCDRLILLCAGQVIAEGTPDEVLTEENIRNSYHARVRMGSNPLTTRPMLLTMQTGHDLERESLAKRAHVICGGGTGAIVMRSLIRQGFSVTAGVLNRLDSDERAGQALGVPMSLETPYTAIGQKSRQACAQLIDEADLVFMTDVPIGKGNLANMELAMEALSKGKEVLLIGDDDFVKRDYTDGMAANLFRKLLKNGAKRHNTIEDWLVKYSK